MWTKWDPIKYHFLLYLNIVLSWPEDGRSLPKHVAKYNLIVIIASCLMYIVYWRCVIYYTDRLSRLKHVAKYDLIVIIASCLMYVVYWQCVIYYTNLTSIQQVIHYCIHGFSTKERHSENETVWRETVFAEQRSHYAMSQDRNEQHYSSWNSAVLR